MAAELGYEQAYISALELGTRKPSKEFLRSLVSKLTLSEKDLADLRRVVKESNRRYVLPVEVSTETYLMCHELWERIETLHPAVIKAIRELIRLEDVMSDQPLSNPRRIRRRTAIQEKGAEM